MDKKVRESKNPFLPSEVARLVLGYLKEKNLNKTLSAFLLESPDLKEYWQVLRSGNIPSSTVMGYSLNQILIEFSNLKLNAVRLGLSTVGPSEPSSSGDVDLTQEDVAASIATEHRRAQRRLQDKFRKEKRKSELKATTPSRKSKDKSVKATRKSQRGSLCNKDQLGARCAADTVRNREGESSQVEVAPQTASIENEQSLKRTELLVEQHAESVNNKGGEDNFEFLDRMLEETRWPEKLAENINRALRDCEGGARDQIQKSPVTGSMKVAPELNISSIVEKTESDPAYQNFLKLFCGGLDIPSSAVDIPELLPQNAELSSMSIQQNDSHVQSAIPQHSISLKENCPLPTEAPGDRYNEGVVISIPESDIQLTSVHPPPSLEISHTFAQAEVCEVGSGFSGRKNKNSSDFPCLDKARLGPVQVSSGSCIARSPKGKDMTCRASPLTKQGKSLDTHQESDYKRAVSKCSTAGNNLVGEVSKGLKCTSNSQMPLSSNVLEFDKTPRSPMSKMCQPKSQNHESLLHQSSFAEISQQEEGEDIVDDPGTKSLSQSMRKSSDEDIDDAGSKSLSQSMKKPSSSEDIDDAGTKSLSQSVRKPSSEDIDDAGTKSLFQSVRKPSSEDIDDAGTKSLSQGVRKPNSEDIDDAGTKSLSQSVRKANSEDIDDPGTKSLSQSMRKPSSSEDIDNAGTKSLSQSVRKTSSSEDIDDPGTKSLSQSVRKPSSSEDINDAGTKSLSQSVRKPNSEDIDDPGTKSLSQSMRKTSSSEDIDDAGTKSQRVRTPSRKDIDNASTKSLSQSVRNFGAGYSHEILDENSLSVFSLIEKNVSDMTGEIFIPRAQRTRKYQENSFDERRTREGSTCPIAKSCSGKNIVKDKIESSFSNLRDCDSRGPSGMFSHGDESQKSASSQPPTDAKILESNKKSRSKVSSNLRSNGVIEGTVGDNVSGDSTSPSCDGINISERPLVDEHTSAHNISPSISSPNSCFSGVKSTSSGSKRSDEVALLNKKFEVFDNCLFKCLAEIKSEQSKSSQLDQETTGSAGHWKESPTSHGLSVGLMENTFCSKTSNQDDCAALDDGSARLENPNSVMVVDQEQREKLHFGESEQQSTVEMSVIAHSKSTPYHRSCDTDEFNSSVERASNGYHSNASSGAGFFGHSNTLTCPLYSGDRIGDVNSPRKIVLERNPLMKSCSLPAVYPVSKVVPVSKSSFSSSTHQSAFRFLALGQMQNSSVENLISTCQSAGRNERKKIISVKSHHSPFIPAHCKKNPSRRIAPIEVSASTPSPLQEYPSSPMNFVIDMPHSEPASPANGLKESQTSNKNTASSQISVESFRIKVNPRTPMSSESQGLPSSPSQRKPRRIKPTVLSTRKPSEFSSSKENLSSSVDKSFPFIDDAKTVSSSSDIRTAAMPSEAEAFRLLKSFLSSSYSKPQPQQEITSSNQGVLTAKCGCSVKLNCKHRKGKGKRYLSRATTATRVEKTIKMSESGGNADEDVEIIHHDPKGEKGIGKDVSYVEGKNNISDQDDGDKIVFSNRKFTVSNKSITSEKEDIQNLSFQDGKHVSVQKQSEHGKRSPISVSSHGSNTSFQAIGVRETSSRDSNLEPKIVFALSSVESMAVSHQKVFERTCQQCRYYHAGHCHLAAASPDRENLASQEHCEFKSLSLVRFHQDRIDHEQVEGHILHGEGVDASSVSNKPTAIIQSTSTAINCSDSITPSSEELEVGTHVEHAVCLKVDKERKSMSPPDELLAVGDIGTDNCESVTTHSGNDRKAEDSNRKINDGSQKNSHKAASSPKDSDKLIADNFKVSTVPREAVRAQCLNIEANTPLAQPTGGRLFDESRLQDNEAIIPSDTHKQAEMDGRKVAIDASHCTNAEKTSQFLPCVSPVRSKPHPTTRPSNIASFTALLNTTVTASNIDLFNSTDNSLPSFLSSALRVAHNLDPDTSSGNYLQKNKCAAENVPSDAAAKSLYDLDQQRSMPRISDTINEASLLRQAMTLCDVPCEGSNLPVSAGGSEESNVPLNEHFSEACSKNCSGINPQIQSMLQFPESAAAASDNTSKHMANVGAVRGINTLVQGSGAQLPMLPVFTGSYSSDNVEEQRMQELSNALNLVKILPKPTAAFSGSSSLPCKVLNSIEVLTPEKGSLPVLILPPNFQELFHGLVDQASVVGDRKSHQSRSQLQSTHKKDTKPVESQVQCKKRRALQRRQRIIRKVKSSKSPHRGAEYEMRNDSELRVNSENDTARGVKNVKRSEGKKSKDTTSLREEDFERELDNYNVSSPDFSYRSEDEKSRLPLELSSGATDQVSLATDELKNRIVDARGDSATGTKEKPKSGNENMSNRMHYRKVCEEILELQRKRDSLENHETQGGVQTRGRVSTGGLEAEGGVQKRGRVSTGGLEAEGDVQKRRRGSIHSVEGQGSVRKRGRSSLESFEGQGNVRKKGRSSMENLEGRGSVRKRGNSIESLEAEEAGLLVRVSEGLQNNRGGGGGLSEACGQLSRDNNTLQKYVQGVLRTFTSNTESTAGESKTASNNEIVRIKKSSSLGTRGQGLRERGTGSVQKKASRNLFKDILKDSADVAVEEEKDIGIALRYGKMIQNTSISVTVDVTGGDKIEISPCLIGSFYSCSPRLTPRKGISTKVTPKSQTKQKEKSSMVAQGEVNTSQRIGTGNNFCTDRKGTHELQLNDAGDSTLSPECKGRNLTRCKKSLAKRKGTDSNAEDLAVLCSMENGRVSLIKNPQGVEPMSSLMPPNNDNVGKLLSAGFRTKQEVRSRIFDELKERKSQHRSAKVDNQSSLRAERRQYKKRETRKSDKRTLSNVDEKNSVASRYLRSSQKSAKQSPVLQRSPGSSQVYSDLEKQTFSDSDVCQSFETGTVDQLETSSAVEALEILMDETNKINPLNNKDDCVTLPGCKENLYSSPTTEIFPPEDGINSESSHSEQMQLSSSTQITLSYQNKKLPPKKRLSTEILSTSMFSTSAIGTPMNKSSAESVLNTNSLNDNGSDTECRDTSSALPRVSLPVLSASSPAQPSSHGKQSPSGTVMSLSAEAELITSPQTQTFGNESVQNASPMMFQSRSPSLCATPIKISQTSSQGSISKSQSWVTGSHTERDEHAKVSDSRGVCNSAAQIEKSSSPKQTENVPTSASCDKSLVFQSPSQCVQVSPQGLQMSSQDSTSCSLSVNKRKIAKILRKLHRTKND